MGLFLLQKEIQFVCSWHFFHC